MNVKYDLVVDFARPSKSNTIIISENDTNSRVCHFTLLNNKQPMSMSDVTAATVRAVKKDGSVVMGAADIILDANEHPTNEIEYTLPARVTDYAGTVTMTITLLSEAGEQLTSFEFYLQVRNALFNEDDMISESDLSGFRDLLNRALVAVKKVEDLSTDAELPNPFPIDIEIEGVHYVYTGRDTVEVKLEHLAYLDDDPVIDTIAIDETAASVAAASAEAARSYANQAKTSQQHVDTVDARLTSAINDVNSIKETLDDSLGMAEAYGNTAKANGLVAEGFATGTQNGKAVSEGSPYYQNNAKYFADKKSIEDRLDSANTSKSLSANMGRVLNDVKANKEDVPTQLSQLTEDTDHKTVSQAEKDAWNSKLDNLRAGQNIIIENGEISAIGGENGTTDYRALENKPQINSVGLDGNKTASDLGLATETELTKKFGDFAKITTQTISSVAYKTYWWVAPTSSNQVYGIAVHPTTGKLYRIYNNKGTYSSYAYDTDTDTTYAGSNLRIDADRNGTVQSSVTTSIASNTTLNSAVLTLLKNDATLDSTKQDKISSSNKIAYSNISGTPTIPSKLSDLGSDLLYQTVTSAQKNKWNYAADEIYNALRVSASYAISGNSSIRKSFSERTQLLIITRSNTNGSQQSGIWILVTDSSGSASIFEIASGTNISASVSGTSVTISNASSAGCTAMFIGL